MEEQFDPSYILELAHKIKAGTITDQELAEYNKWYSSVNKDVLELPEAYTSNPLVIRDRMHDDLLAQVAAVNTGNAIQVVKVNAEYAVAWKNGYFMFNDEPLENILLEVSRWYNVQISYDLPEIRKMRFYGTVSRFENVSKVLEKLELTDKVKFEIKDKQIKVFRKNP